MGESRVSLAGSQTLLVLNGFVLKPQIRKNFSILRYLLYANDARRNETPSYLSRFSVVR